MPRTRTQRPLQYRDRQRRVWYVSEVARLKVVSPSIDGPNLALVIRFQREGEERLARWLGAGDWREPPGLERLFESATPPANAPDKASGMGAAPPETVKLWCHAVRSMGPDELADFERRTFATWDPRSLGDLRRAIERRRRELAG